MNPFSSLLGKYLEKPLNLIIGISVFAVVGITAKFLIETNIAIISVIGIVLFLIAFVVVIISFVFLGSSVITYFLKGHIDQLTENSFAFAATAITNVIFIFLYGKPEIKSLILNYLPIWVIGFSSLFGVMVIRQIYKKKRLEDVQGEPSAISSRLYIILIFGVLLLVGFMTFVDSQAVYLLLKEAFPYLSALKLL